MVSDFLLFSFYSLLLFLFYLNSNCINQNLAIQKEYTEKQQKIKRKQKPQSKKSRKGAKKAPSKPRAQKQRWNKEETTALHFNNMASIGKTETQDAARYLDFATTIDVGDGQPSKQSRFLSFHVA